MSVKGKEYQLLVRIAGTIDKTFDASMAKAQTSLKARVAAMDKDFTNLDKGVDKFISGSVKAFETMAKVAGLAAVAVGGVAAASIAVGSSFETAFAGVKKTVDATEEEYAKLRQDILDMSTEIPSTANEIAQTMEIAGQLGVATESLTDFTKTMINLGVSTNMTAEEAATALARFANITGMSDFAADGTSNWERLGSTIVDLGNNFATTESEISEMAMKLASTGSIIGVSEPQILALATAMSSVGIKAEAGGSAMSKILKKMQIAVETNSGALEDYASVANMTTKEFSKAFKDDATSALFAFIKGLNDTKRNGKSAVAVLDEMGLNEVRLSNTILALANSTDLFQEALNLADEAWEEGNALANEAGKRYETVESKVSILRNTIVDSGIAIYDELRPTIVSVLDVVSEKIAGLAKYIQSSSGISKWLADIGAAVPTLQRKIKTYGKIPMQFFSAVIDFGKWCIKNPRAIVSVIAGIGTALVTYKVVSGITHLVNAIMSLNPVTLIITGVMVAISALVSAFTNYKLKEQELMNEDLANHFGNIALSMNDIEQIAEHIVGSKYLDGVREALDAFDGLDEFSDEIENYVKTINKLNWKVSIGLELSDDEKENYLAAIDGYVKAANEYALQAQYAVSINMSLVFDENDLEQSNLVTKVNKFYSDKAGELAQLGTDLNKAITDAFNDGFLEIDEIDTITNIQKQMADIQKQLAASEYEAALSFITGKYSGKSLSSDAFQNLQVEISDEVKKAEDAYKESYIKNRSAIAAAYSGGYMTTSEYDAAIAKLDESNARELADLQIRAAQYQIEAIMNAYGGELGKYGSNINDVLSKYNSEFDAFNTTVVYEMIADAVDDGNAKSSKMAVGALLSNMGGSIETIYSLMDEWDKLSPELQAELKGSIEDIEFLKAFSTYKKFYGYGGAGEQAVVRSLVNASESGSFSDYATQNYSMLMGRNPIVVDETPSLPVLPLTLNNGKLSNTLNKLSGIGSISAHGIGGIVPDKQISWLAENGPESVIPLNGSSRAIELWRQTGQLLGMKSIDGFGGSVGGGITYSPTIQFYGGTPSKEDLTDALRLSQDEFDAMMGRWMKRQNRLSY